MPILYDHPEGGQRSPLPGRADLDEAARPSAPAIQDATDTHRAFGRQLAMIHAHHRRELAQVRRVLTRIEDDAAAAGDLTKVLNTMAIAQNLRLFGAICGRECQHLQFHHNIEEGHTFPTLEQNGSEGLRAVVAKLRKEHEVVHTLIGALSERGAAFVQNPAAATLADLKEVISNLEEVVDSHFSYEERELEEALGVHGGL